MSNSINYILYDSKGNRLDHLTQWDVNRVLVFSGLEVDAAPCVHFYNARSTKAMVVQSEAYGTDSYRVTIPNSILREPLAIDAAIYDSDFQTRECTSLDILRLPLYPREMPEDYEVGDDPEYVNFQILVEQVGELVTQVTGVVAEATAATEAAEAAAAAVTGMSADAHSLAAGAQPTATITGGTGGTPYHIAFGIPKGENGDKGDKGNGIVSTGAVNAYAVGNGTTIPTTGWTNDPASLNVPKGSWLWVRTTINYTDAGTSPTVSYAKAYQGLDGFGTVNSVAGISPDSNNDVPLITQSSNAPTTATANDLNKLWYDTTSGIMYICKAASGGTYAWSPTGSPVDASMVAGSTNPVQSQVIASNFLRYTAAQTLTFGQKQTAMQNLGFTVVTQVTMPSNNNG